MPRPEVDAALDAWVHRPSSIFVEGPDGSGRSRALDQLADTLTDQGLPWLRITPGASPWAAVDEALEEPLLPLPPAPLPDHRTPARRAQAAARRLAARAPAGLRVLIDDLHRHDSGTQEVVAALVSRPGLHVCASGSQAPPWATAALHLEPLDSPRAAELIGAWLGGNGLPEGFVEQVLGEGQGLPGRLLLLVAEAVGRGAIRAQRGGWVWADRDGSSPTRLGPTTALSSEALLVVAAVVAAKGTARRGELGAVTGLSEEALHAAIDSVVARGVLRVDQGRVRCPSPENQAAVLSAEGIDLPALFDAWVRVLVQRPSPPWSRLAGLLVAAGQVEAARMYGAAALNALLLRDPAGAPRVARTLWGLAPSADLAVPVMRTLEASGRANGAIELGRAFLRRADPSALLVPVHTLLARLLVDAGSDEEGARAEVRRAWKLLGSGTPPCVLLEVDARLYLGADKAAQALTLARLGLKAAPPEEPHERRAWLGLRLIESRALVAAGRSEVAVERLAAGPPEPGHREREKLDAERAILLWQQGRYAESAAAFQDAARCDPESMGVEQVRWLDRAGQAHYHGGDRPQAIECWSAAASMARLLDHHDELIRIQVHLTSALLEVGRDAEASALGVQAYEAASARGELEQAVNVALSLTDLELNAGRLDIANAWLTRAAHVVGDQELPRLRPRVLRRWAELSVRRGDPAAFEQCLAAIRVATRADSIRDVCRATALKAVCLARRGELDQVGPTLERAASPLRESGSARTLAEVRLWSAEAWLAAHEPERAVEEACRVVVWADEVGHAQFRERAEGLLTRARTAAQPEVAGPSTGADRLLDLTLSLSREADPQRTLNLIAEAAVRLVPGDRAFLLTLRDGELHVVAAASAEGAPVGRPSSSVTRTTLARGREVIVKDTAERRDLRDQESIQYLQVRSVMCLPVFEVDQLIGALYVDSHGVSDQELDRSTRMARALASLMSLALARSSRVIERDAQRRRMLEVAHDLRSPLTSLLLAANEVLLAPGASDEVRAAARLIEAQARRVAALTDNLLTADGAPPARAVVELVALTRQLIERSMPDARHRGQTFRLEAPAALLVHDRDAELERALENLLSNALRHAPPGSTIHVSLGLEEQEARWTIEDEGDGVPDSIVDRIFEPGVKRSPDGLGLGLSIVRRVVEGLGGRVEADTAPSGGAAFHLYLPLASRTQG